MRHTQIEGYNAIFGADQRGVYPLKARKEDGSLGTQHVAQFELSDDDVARIKAGERRIHLTIVGSGWPPVILEVAEDGA